MLKKGDSVFIWLFDDGARAVLGAPPTTQGQKSRWVAIGSVIDADDDIWLDSGRIEEWKSDGSKVAWKFSPKRFLVRREFIVTVQLVKSGDNTIGFKADPVEGE